LARTARRKLASGRGAAWWKSSHPTCA
jgi:hypothetical protein